MTNSYQPSSNHSLMERASGGGNFSGGLPSLSLPISATIDGYNSFPIEAQTHGPARMLVDQTRLRVTKEPNVMHPSLNSSMNQQPSATFDGFPRTRISSASDNTDFVRPYAPASQFARYPPRKSIFSGDCTEQSNHYSESSPSSRVAPYHLPPIQVAATSPDNSNRISSPQHRPTSSPTVARAVDSTQQQQQQQRLYHPGNRVLAEPVVTTGGFHPHHASSSSGTIHLSSPAPSFLSREPNRSMSEYLLYCAADQQEKQLASNRDKNNNTWPKSWDRRRFSSQEDKSRAIIIDSRPGDEDSEGKEREPLQEINHCTASPSTPFAPSPVADYRHPHRTLTTASLKHLVSPHAIRQAEQEEQDEAMGGPSEHPFSAFPSFMSMKHLHQDQIKAYYHRNSKSTSPPPHVSIPASTLSPNYTTESPSPSSSVTFSPLSGQATVHQQQQPILPDPHSQHHPHHLHHPYSLVDWPPHDQQQMHQPAKVRERLKRPPNAYLLFNREMRRKLLETAPKMTVSEISKEIGERWKHLPEDRRQPYIRQAAMIKQDHLKNHPDFIYTRRSKAEIAEAKKMAKSRKTSAAVTKSTGSSSGVWMPSSFGDPAGLGSADQTMTDKRRRRKDAMDGPRDPRGRKKKRHRHPTAPKHPMSGFLFYLSAVRPQVAQKLPGSTVGPISKIIARQWRDMTDQERIPWLEKAEQDKARYAREMQAYMASLEEGDEHRVVIKDGLGVVNPAESLKPQPVEQHPSVTHPCFSNSDILQSCLL